MAERVFRTFWWRRTLLALIGGSSAAGALLSDQAKAIAAPLSISEGHSQASVPSQPSAPASGSPTSPASYGSQSRGEPPPVPPETPPHMTSTPAPAPTPTAPSAAPVTPPVPPPGGVSGAAPPGAMRTPDTGGPPPSAPPQPQPQAGEWASEYGSLTVDGPDDLEFYYIRQDLFLRMGGTIPQRLARLSESDEFGPYPAGGAVTARRGSIYLLIPSCADQLSWRDHRLVRLPVGLAEGRTSLTCRR